MPATEIHGYDEGTTLTRQLLRDVRAWKLHDFSLEK